MGIGSSGVANYANTRLALAIRTIALGNMGDFEVVSDDGVGLGLNFQTMTALDPRITFSRASNATVVGSDGLVQYAPHNLLTYSENFDNAVWVKTTSTVTANTVIAPDGTTTADRFIPSAGVSSPSIIASFSAVQGVTYVLSVYVAPDFGNKFLMLQFDGDLWNGVSSTERPRVWFDPTSGQITATQRIIGSGVEVAQNGYYRVYMTATCTTAGATAARITMQSNSGSASGYTGDGTSGIYLWGAQLNEGSLQPYYTTSVKNLLGYSQNFDNAAGWVSAAPYSVTPNTITGPDGVTNADAIILASGSTSFNTNVTRQIVTKAASAVRYTHSCYIKAKGAATSVRIVDFGSTTANSALVIVSLIDGSIISAPSVTGTFTGASVTVESLQNGWFRIALTYTTDTATTLTVRHFPYNGNTQLLGDGDSGLYLWGAQLSDSASLDPYSYNFGAAPTSTAYYGPRFDYDPVTLAPKGLLIEEQRTNSALNSNTFNLSAGTTETLNATISPDGTQNASLITETTANGEHYSLDRGIAVTSGTTYVWSFYAKQGNGSARKAYCRVATAATASVIFDLVTGSGFVASSTNLVTYGSQQLSNGWWRCFVVFTAASTATAVCRAQLATGSNVSIYTGDGVSGIYLWGAQLEAGAFPTSYIPTTSAAVTRAADNASMVGTNFSSWYNQSEGAMVCSSDSPQTTTTAAMNWYLTNTATDNTMFNRKNLANTLSNAVVVGNVAQGDVTSGTTISANAVVQSAFSYKLNDLAISVNGASIGSDNLANIPTVEKLFLGSNAVAGQLLNGHIQSIRYYPRRLANGDLQALTR